MTKTLLPSGLPTPPPNAFGLDAPFWRAASEGKLAIQRCSDCSAWRWGPEWICHKCHSFEYRYDEVEPVGHIYSLEKVFHAAHPVLKECVPYFIVLVGLPHADNVRIVGNLLETDKRDPEIGDQVVAHFETHIQETGEDYTLVQWVLT